MNNSIELQALNHGEKGRVVEMTGNAEEIARLSALGIRTGASVCGLRRGATCMFRCGNSRLCLRACPDLQIMVVRD